MKKSTIEKANDILRRIGNIEKGCFLNPLSCPVIEIIDGGVLFTQITQKDNNPYYQPLIDSLKEKREKELNDLYKELEDLKDE